MALTPVSNKSLITIHLLSENCFPRDPKKPNHRSSRLPKRLGTLGSCWFLRRSTHGPPVFFQRPVRRDLSVVELHPGTEIEPWWEHAYLYLRWFLSVTYFAVPITQCFAKSAASFVLQSPFGFSFILSHHSLLPTSGEHAVNGEKTKTRNNIAAILIPKPPNS